MAVTCQKINRPFGTSHVVRNDTVELGVVHSGTYQTAEYRREDYNDSDTWAFASAQDGWSSPIVPDRDIAVAMLVQHYKGGSNG